MFSNASITHRSPFLNTHTNVGPRACIGRKFATVESVCFLTLLLREFLKERLRLRLVWLMFLLDLLGERGAREYRGYLRKCNLYIVKIGDLLPLANNPYYRIGLGLEV